MSNSFVSILPSTSQQTQMSRHIPWKIWDTRWILFTKVDFGIVLRRLDDYCLIDRVTKDLGIRQLLSYWMTRRWLIFEVWQRIKSLFLRKVKIIKIQNQLEIKKPSQDKYFDTFQTKYVTSFSPFVLRNCAMHDPFLNDIYNSKEAEKYFSDIVGEDLRWH